jgi:hypothetical protein
MNIESELREVLKRVDPLDGFADRVMRRGTWAPAESRRYIHRAIAAGILLAVTIGGWGIHETLRARNELLTAMRIASQKVAHAQQAVRR